MDPNKRKANKNKVMREEFQYNYIFLRDKYREGNYVKDKRIEK